MKYVNTLITIAAITVWVVPRTWAVDRSWSASPSGSWITGANWSPAGTPTSSDTLRIRNDGTATISLGEDAYAAGVEMGSGSFANAGHVNMSGGTLTIGTTDVGGGFSFIMRRASTFTQTGGYSYFGASANGVVVGATADTASFTLSGGTATFASSLFTGRGTATGVISVGGTGTIIVNNTLVLADSGTGSGTFNLNTGGLLQVKNIKEGTGGYSIFNFNGGTLVANTSTTSFMAGLNEANILAGGAIINTAGYAITASTSLGNGGSGGLTVTGGGTLTLTAGNNVYSGNTTVLNGRLIVGGGSVNPLPSTTVVTLGSGTASGVLQFGNSQTLSGIATSGTGMGNAIVGNNASVLPLTIDNASDYVFAGALGGPGVNENNFRVVKTGAGILTLAGVSTFTGGLQVNGGTLSVTGGITGANTLETATTGGNITVSPGATFTIGNGNLVDGFSTIFRGTSSFIQTGGTSSFGSATGINSVALGSTSGNATFSISGGAATVNGIFRVASSADATLNLNGGTFKVTKITQGTSTGTINFNGGTLMPNTSTTSFMSGVSTAEIKSGGANIDTAGFDVTIGQTLSGSGSLTKAGTGALTLSGANTFSGDTIISSGTLTLSDSLALQNSTLDYNNYGGTLSFGALTSATFGGLKGAQDLPLPGVALSVGNNNQNTVYTGILSNTGSLTKIGTGSLELGGVNTYSGETIVSDGELLLSDASALGTTAGSTTVSSGTRLVLANGITIVGETATISGNGGNYNGALQAAAGAAATWNGPVVLGASDARVGAGIGGTLTIGGAVQGSGGNQTLTISAGDFGAATVVLSAASGNNTYSGSTSIIRGTLQLGATDNLPTGTTLDVDSSTAAQNAIFDLNGFSQTVGVLTRSNTGGAGGSYVTNSSGTPATLTVNQTANTTYGGSITGNLALSKTGSGRLTLAGPGSYTEATTVTGGMLQLQHGSAVSGTSSISVSGGAIFALDGGITASGGTLVFSGLPGDSVGPFRATSGASTWTGPVKLGSDQARLGALAGATLTVAGVIDSGANIWGPAIRTADATGTVILSGANTYLGNTAVVVGRLQLGGGDDRLPVGTVLTIGNGSNVASALFDLGGVSQTVAGLAHAGTTMPVSIVNSSLTTGTLTVNNSSANSFRGTLSGNLALAKSGGGTLALTAANSFTGGVTVNAGQLNINNDTALGAASGVITLNGGAIGNSSGGVRTITNNNPITINGDFTADVTGNSINLGTGPVSLGTAAGTSRTITVNGWGLTIGGGISDGTTATSLTKAGTGVLYLTGASTYTGLTTIRDNGGRLTLNNTSGVAIQSDVLLGDGSGGGDAYLYFSADEQIGDTATINFTPAGGQFGRFVLLGHTETVGGIQNTTGNGIIESTETEGGYSATPAHLIVNNNANNSFNGYLRDRRVAGASDGRLALTKGGTGTLTLDGGNITYSAGTTINDGVLDISGATAFNTSGTVTINGGKLLYGSSTRLSNLNKLTMTGGTLEGSGNVSSSANFDLQAGTVEAPLAGSGGLDKTGPGTVKLSAANTYSGDTTISAGTLLAANSGAIPTGSGKGNVIVNGTLDLGGFDLSPNGLTGTGTIDNSTGAGTYTLAVGNNNTSSTFAGTIQDTSGTVTLTKVGSGTITLSGANTYTGATSVTGGTLKLQNDNAVSGTSGVSVANETALALDGGITVSGTTVTIIGDGGADNSGALKSTSGANTWNGPVILGANQARLGAQGGATLTVSGTIDDGPSSYELVIRNNTSAGAVVLSGANTYGGNTRLYIGTLQVGADNTLPSSTVLIMDTGVAGTSVFDLNGFDQTLAGITSGNSFRTITDSSATPGTLTVVNNTNRTYGGKLAGGFTLDYTGSADITLSGDNSGFTGTMLMNNGKLIWGADSAGSASATWNLAVSTIVAAYNTFGAAGAHTVQLGALTGVTGTTLRNGGGTGAFSTTTFEVGALGIDTTFDGSIVDQPGFPLTVTALTKTGSGLLALTAGNTYTGGTTINGGTLSFGTGALGTTGSLEFTGTSALRWASGNTTDVSPRMKPLPSGIVATFDTGFGNVSFANAVTGGGGVGKDGSGILTLTQDNTYTGPTTINGGTLKLVEGTSNNTIASSPTITVAAGATLDGTGLAGPGQLILSTGQVLAGDGTVNAKTQVGGGAMLSPGSSPGMLTFYDTMTWTAGGIYHWEINDWTGTPGVDPGWDLIQLNGYLDLAALDSANQFTIEVVSLTLANTAGLPAHFDRALDQEFKILDTSGVGVDGSFTTNMFVLNTGSFGFSASYASWSIASHDNALWLQYSAMIPEPTTVMLFGLGGLLLWVGRRAPKTRSKIA